MLGVSLRQRFRQWGHGRLSSGESHRQHGSLLKPRRPNEQMTGGKLADVMDLTGGAFGGGFIRRFPDGVASVLTRKLWEMCWLAEKFEELRLGGPAAAVLGLGVGQEPLIYHFAHLAAQVVATDLYSNDTAWDQARLPKDNVFSCNPFPYPRERLRVENMDMRRLDFPSQSFDVVWSCSSVEHMATLPQFVQVFREIHRVLKPGGVVLITTEFSLDEPYFLPGVLSLWKDCALFAAPLEGLTLVGPVDLRYHGAVPGNGATPRRDVPQCNLVKDCASVRCGLCLNVGYTRLIPVAFALQKTGEQFGWPDHLGAPPWYRPFAAGVEAFEDKTQAAQAAACFQEALGKATQGGARLHCYRYLIEALVHAGQVGPLQTALRQCAADLRQFPDDDDALDLIAYVAAGQGMLGFAHRCWERAYECPAVFPSSRLRIRHNQLAAELKANGLSDQVRHLNALADTAWREAVSYHGPENPQVRASGTQLDVLRQAFHLPSLREEQPCVPTGTVAPPLPAAPVCPPVTPSNPAFDLANPPVRPMVYIGDHLALTKTVYGHKMYVDTRSQMGACFLLDGYWEEWITRHLREFVRPGMRALDIGANMGFYSLLLGDLVGPNGRVIAFEPWPHFFQILRRNLEINGFLGRATLERKSVHAVSGRQELSFYEDYGTGSVGASTQQLEEPGTFGTPCSLQVESVSLDDYFATDLGPIDFIKIDADGSEPFIFQGMKGLLRRDHPLTIFCEFSPTLYRTFGVDPQAFLEELTAAGFQLSEFVPEGIKEVRSLPALLNSTWAELLLVRK